MRHFDFLWESVGRSESDDDGEKGVGVREDVGTTIISR
jgi:hypothetical protein